MVYASGPVGDRFERYFSAHFPGFESHTNDGEGVPDFYNPKFGFWVETKAGHVGWGVRLKAHQLRFESLTEPVVYCMGLHELDNVQEMVRGRSDQEAARILGRRMDFSEVYFVTREIVDAVMQRETRISKKDHRIYCSMKKHMFRDLLQNRSFRRHGVSMPTAEGFYGYDRSQFDFYDLSTPRPREIVPVRGVVLSKTKDQVVAEYLRQEEIIA